MGVTIKNDIICKTPIVGNELDSTRSLRRKKNREDRKNKYIKK